ncbi:MAG: gas vesicle protein GvpG [Actinobacteria bacterium]|nr:gas vesicle protein GvpG [Actinomycetota bacterium]MBU4179055.1 gas vesicle protein GvpG [Actinomycetota bacterium]MBU4403769.1 gas vesicle protein GvpG [Actinomycetota bacterium]MCG2819304.1 gas vesicle protein GvpG [Actinomycetes bacterium]
MAFLVDDILLAPFKMVTWVCKKLEEAADEEVSDESRWHERLLELQIRYELGEISEEEFDREEERIMERLSSILESKE